jgi:hypothetical protein
MVKKQPTPWLLAEWYGQRSVRRFARRDTDQTAASPRPSINNIAYDWIVVKIEEEKGPAAPDERGRALVLPYE